MRCKTLALVRIADKVADASLEGRKQQVEDRDSALAEFRCTRLLPMEEDGGHVRGASHRNRETHRIEYPVGGQEILMNLALPELSQPGAVEPPAIPHLEAQLFTSHPPEVYRLVVPDVRIEHRLRIVLTVEKRNSWNVELKRGPVGPNQLG